jgi:hypothetical protein
VALACKLALSPLLLAQAIATRRRALVLPEAGGPRDGLAGEAGTSGELPIRVLIAGDSSAAGVGVAQQDRAVAGYFVRALDRHTVVDQVAAAHAAKTVAESASHCGARPGAESRANQEEERA